MNIRHECGKANRQPRKYLVTIEWYESAVSFLSHLDEDEQRLRNRVRHMMYDNVVDDACGDPSMAEVQRSKGHSGI